MLTKSKSNKCKYEKNFETIILMDGSEDLGNMFVDNQPESETETVDDDDESDNDSSKYYLNKKLP